MYIPVMLTARKNIQVFPEMPSANVYVYCEKNCPL